MTRGCQLGECPRGLTECPGLQEVSGDTAKAYVGPYMVMAARYGLVRSTAIVCPNISSEAVMCEKTIQDALDSRKGRKKDKELEEATIN